MNLCDRCGCIFDNKGLEIHYCDICREDNKK